MKKLYLFLFAGALLASCTKVTEPTTTDSDERDGAAMMTRSAAGSNVDPYKLSLVQSILDEQLALTRSGERIVLEPTHLYVKFLPQDSTQLLNLEAMNIDLFYRPIDDTDYVEPEEPEEDAPLVFEPVYSVVPAGFVFPNGIEHELMYPVYIQSLDGSGSASGSQIPIDLYKSVMTEALNKTGNVPATRAGTVTEWTPSARFRLLVGNTQYNVPVDTIAMYKLRVFVCQGSRREELYTDKNGEVAALGKFIGGVTYEVHWDNAMFAMRRAFQWGRRVSGIRGTYTSKLDHLFTTEESLEYFLAGVHRALVAYFHEHYPNTAGLKISGKHLNVGILDRKPQGWDGWSGRYIPGIVHPMALYTMSTNGIRYWAVNAMNTTFHELGHVSHNTGQSETYYWKALTKSGETWGNCVQYAYMSSLFPSYTSKDDYSKKYSLLGECLMKNGVSLFEIQAGFFDSTDWDGWRIEMKNKDILRERLVNLIFEHPDTYTYDIRDIINVSQSPANKFCPISVTVNKEASAWLVKRWEILEGSTIIYDSEQNVTDDSVLKVLSADSSRLDCYFKEAGNRTLLVTTAIPTGDTCIYKKQISVRNQNVISVPQEIKLNYTYEATLVKPSNCPNAKVKNWSIPVGGEIKKIDDTRATFKFTQEGDKTIRATVEFAPSLIVDCEVKVKVAQQKDEDVFAFVNKPAMFEYGQPFEVQYMSTGSAITITEAYVHHYTAYYIMLPPSVLKYTVKPGNKFEFKIMEFGENLPFDYKLFIKYKVDGDPKIYQGVMAVSNLRDHL